MRIFILLTTLLFIHFKLSACTTFFLHAKGQMVFGRNYDWITDAGMVYTNLKGLSKTSLKTADGEPITWTSKYGSITFNQYGKEFPTGGMNEKGLVVELMWLDETRYPSPDSRPSISVLQWIQFQLDNCSTVEEVIATDKMLRITTTGTPLHYLVADASGNAATIEWLEGKLVSSASSDLTPPVLTNSVYKESVSYYKKASSASGNAFAFGNNSLQRFDEACQMIRQYQSQNMDTPPVDYAFNILSNVSQGAATKWSIVYDITQRKIHFRTNRFQEQKIVSLSDFDFTCSSPAKAWNMNQLAKGAINHLFLNYDAETNKKLVETSFKESAGHISVEEATRKRIWEYPAQIHCK
jgi:penicillin V acylase-like amidase (Ntn superfamily)